MSLIRFENVKVSGSDWTDLGTYSATAITSDPIRIGAAGIEADVIFAPGNNSMSASLVYELSADGTNFYAPVNSSNISIADLVYNNASLTTTRLVSFQPAAGEWIRFVLTPKAATPSTNTTLQFIQQEDY